MEGYFISEKCICKLCTSCDNGQWLKSECGGKADTECVTHTKCDGTTKFQAQEGTHTKDTTCNPCKTCPQGQTQNTDCSEKADRTCKVCSKCGETTWTKFRTEECTANEDTVCQDCVTCNDDEFEESACSETRNRVCRKCTPCDGKTNFESTPCSAQANTQCSACTQCSSEMEYEKTACSNKANTVCATYGLTVKGNEKNIDKSTTTKQREDDIAMVRCVNDDVGISVCTDATDVQKKSDQECSKAFVDSLKAAQNKKGKQSHGACKPKSMENEMTLANAQTFCKDLDMRVPQTQAELTRAEDTGCGFDTELVWYAGVSN